MFCSLNHELIFFVDHVLCTHGHGQKGKIYLNPQARGGLNKNRVLEHVAFHVTCYVSGAVCISYIYIFICVYYVRVFVSLPLGLH